MEGHRINAFSDGKAKLESLGYEFEPVQLYDVPLPAYLDLINRNWTVAIAATPDVAAQLRANRPGWRRLGVSDNTIFEQKVGAPAIVGVNDAGGQAIEAIGLPEARATVAVNAPDYTSQWAVAAVEAAATREEAVVSVNGVVRARVHRGAVLVLIDPRGAVDVYPIEAARNLRIPFDMKIFSLFHVTGAVSCSDVGNAGWTDIAGDVAPHGPARRQLPAVRDVRAFLPHRGRGRRSQGHRSQGERRRRHHRQHFRPVGRRRSGQVEARAGG